MIMPRRLEELFLHDSMDKVTFWYSKYRTKSDYIQHQKAIISRCDNVILTNYQYKMLSRPLSNLPTGVSGVPFGMALAVYWGIYAIPRVTVR